MLSNPERTANFEVNGVTSLRAKQSFTATEILSSTENLTPLPIRTGNSVFPSWQMFEFESAQAFTLAQPETRTAKPVAESMAADEDLLHGARNLIGALGFCSDLLALPGVLKEEHRQYVDDLRLVGTRSGTLVGRMIGQLVQTSAVVAKPAAVADAGGDVHVSSAPGVGTCVQIEWPIATPMLTSVSGSGTERWISC
jgi:hypothetical protein